MNLRSLSALLETAVSVRSNQPVEPLLAVVNHWKGALYPFDQLRSAIDRLTRVGGELRGAEGEDRVCGAYEIQGAVDHLAELMFAIYPAYRDGRERLYAVAEFWRMPTPRKVSGRAPDALSVFTKAELASDLKRATAAMTADLKKLDALGSKCISALYGASRTPPEEDEDRKRVLDDAFDFRDAGAQLFLHATTAIRRARELAAPTTGDRWTPTWSPDPEVGAREA